MKQTSPGYAINQTFGALIARGPNSRDRAGVMSRPKPIIAKQTFESAIAENGGYNEAGNMD